uniref:Uncharacterized protein n=1 Tax=Compsopogon caeruleus TaxID=31354 RepID=A0A7S1TI61_9RHOD|mmetsp:Transcript_8820/g.17820  ORF Transcript_8820/g.17820 Transcript_8820/m.17820 type:complete len:216 (+) Transcript_8820:225-872(+)|eukprot:CAMPEP_0184681698 /NCGR_PEP_ID=MMETSP0312-20130426/4681_1 /TAXON_ID=31354 /ORGANISM="Compsopogon coeruleus, Strain SAG 36.94" /LENGTH=215 /DNA_ID=CAMNT_0027132699 /DNA_START=169 /DNA_END=816 /DNA_ORIENTATION=+
MVSSAFVSGAPVILRSSFTQKLSQRRAVVAKSSLRMQTFPVFTEAMKTFADEFPQFAKLGWGCTVKAERWNGRHAMFGMLAIVLTAYAKGHGMIPEADKLLDVSAWGTLAELGNYTPISNERAIILVAHIHVLLVSIAAAIAPFSFQDKLLLAPGEEDEAPAGLIPAFNLGLTKDAEIWNGRLAMLGICSIVGSAVASGSSILDVVNVMFGKIFF